MPMPRRSGRHLQPGLRHDAIGRARISPPCTGSKPARQRSTVVLPQPGRPEQAADAARLRARSPCRGRPVRAIGVLERADANGGGHRRDRAGQPAAQRHGAAARSRRRRRACAASSACRPSRRRRRSADSTAARSPRSRSRSPTRDLRHLERGVERVGLREPLLEERLAEERRTALRPSQPNDVRSACDAVMISVWSSCSGADEAAGVARGHDDDPPLDAGVVEQLLQARRA